MIVIQNEITPEEMLKGINAMKDYRKRRFVLMNIELDTKKHSSKVLLYKSVNKINEFSLTREERAILLNFYTQQIKFLEELN